MIIEPDFYKNFACAAGGCPDTCCKGWDIVVDDETLAFYENTDEDICKNIMTDSDGDTVLKFVNGVCPFLDENKLCRIQTKYGGDKLCRTCREFPRITQDYTAFEERLLTLACPEAARLMIIENADHSYMFAGEIGSGIDIDYSAEYMDFLLTARKMTADIFSRDEDFDVKMRRALSFTENVQQLIDDENFDVSLLADFEPLPELGDAWDDIFELHAGLDVIDRDWVKYAVSCRSQCVPRSIGGELSRLALYYIARYYLTAIDTYDVITTIKRIFCAAAVCGAQISCESDANARALVYQKYSKEIEHSDENLDLMTDAFLDEKFSSSRLLLHMN